MELLKRLNDSFSASGYEDEIREVVKAHLSQWYDVRVDALGNVIASKNNGNKHYVLLAPMDSCGYYLNHPKCKGSYFYTKLSSAFKGNPKGAKGRTFCGATGSFTSGEDEDKLVFNTEGQEEIYSEVADIIVPFSESEHRVTSRHASLYALLLFAERAKDLSLAFTFVALAQTSLRHRGAFGDFPRDADLFVLVQPTDSERFVLGEGAVLCLKDGAYLCPDWVKKQCEMFENRLVCEEKPSLAFTIASQHHGRMVTSLKIPTAHLGTAKETFCLNDLKDLCDKLLLLCEKGLTKS